MGGKRTIPASRGLSNRLATALAFAIILALAALFACFAAALPLAAIETLAVMLGRRGVR